jgi:hypothetical protein
MTSPEAKYGKLRRGALSTARRVAGLPFRGAGWVFFGVGWAFLIVAERVSMLGSYIAGESDEL